MSIQIKHFLPFFKGRWSKTGGVLSFTLSALVSLFSPHPVTAQCPVCIVTVGGGMLLAKKLGIDDLLVAIWISALNTVLSYWAAPKIKIRFLNNPALLSLLMYLMTLAYFQFTGQLFVTGNTILNTDKILLGMTAGLLGVMVGNYLYAFFKRRNNDKALFPYSKVVFPVGLVLLITLIFKFGFNL